MQHFPPKSVLRSLKRLQPKINLTGNTVDHVSAEYMHLLLRRAIDGAGFEQVGQDEPCHAVVQADIAVTVLNKAVFVVIDLVAAAALEHYSPDELFVVAKVTASVAAASPDWHHDVPPSDVTHTVRKLLSNASTRILNQIRQAHND